MEHALAQHQVEIERNRRFWDAKPLLREVYAGFYDRIVAQIDRRIPERSSRLAQGSANSSPVCQRQSARTCS